MIPKFICKNEKTLLHDISNVPFKVLAQKHHHQLENYHILYNGEKCVEAIKAFIFGFREKYCQQEKSNIFLYDDESVKDLIDVYPLEGDKLELVTKHFIALSPFDAPDYVRMYPYK